MLRVRPRFPQSVALNREMVQNLHHKTLATAPPPIRRLTPSLHPSQPPVAVFWDLNSKPPTTVSLYDAAIRLSLAATSFGPVRFTVAYTNPRSSRHAATSVDGGHLICRVCGRNFRDHGNLINHFRQIHEREQRKRLNRLESSRGTRKVRLAAQLSLKMDKFRKASRELLVPSTGFRLANDLERAGVLVRHAEDRDQFLRTHIMHEMDRGRIGCFVLVSDNAGFVDVLKEARIRRLMTVVIEEEGDGPLRRCADSGFSWKEVISGKARKAAGSAVWKWKDKDLLKELEWSYVPDCDATNFDAAKVHDGDDADEFLGLLGKGVSRPWWKLNSETDDC